LCDYLNKIDHHQSRTALVVFTKKKTAFVVLLHIGYNQPISGMKLTK
jgi:hypothetical protein